MATDYRRVSNPNRPWSDDEIARFNEIREKLRWESYPNGNSGWESYHQGDFEREGYVVKKLSRGDACNIERVWFDVA